MKILSFGPFFIIFAAILWSFDGVLRRSLYTLPPSVVVFYEHLLGAMILFTIFPRIKKESRKMTKRVWIAIILVSLFSGALGTIFYTAALGKVNYIQYSVVVLLQQLQPIWAITAAVIVLKEKVNKNFIIWALLALVSAYFVTFPNLRVNFISEAGTVVAAILAVGAGFLWGTSTAISKYVLNRISYLVATFLRFLIAPMFALLFIFGFGQQQLLFSLNSDQWLALIFITLSTGMVALAVYYYGLKRTPARVSTICELVWPASAIFIDYFYYHKSLTITQFMGVFFLLLAIYKVSRFRR